MSYRYRLTRNVDARDHMGREVKIAIATVIHENGLGETVAISEDLIKFAGPEIIPAEIDRAMKR